MSNVKRQVSNREGFTLVELVVVMGILIILGAVAIPTIFDFQKESALNDGAREIISTLSLAQSKTLASEGGERWGVYFTTSTSPHQYVLFKGGDFASRDTSFDEVSRVFGAVEFFEINFGGGQEIVFDRITGETSQTGKVSLRLKDKPGKFRTVYVESSGRAGMSTSSVSDDDRLKDSRHVHFDYGRQIATSTEKLILTFEGGVIEEIVIADYVKQGEFFWEGEVEVGGEFQTLKIHTHRFNNPDTQFSIHRDRRYNNKSLDIDISGDPDYPALSPTLIRYDSAGVTTEGNSVYVSIFIWQ